MSGTGMENGMKWFPEAGVLPVIQSPKMRSVSPWVHKRMMSEPNEWDAETAAKDLARRSCWSKMQWTYLKKSTNSLYCASNCKTDEE